LAEVEIPLETKLRTDLGTGDPIFAEWFLQAGLLWRQRGDLERRTQAPDPVGQPPSVPSLDLPAPIARLQAARARYVAGIEADRDFDDHLRSYALDHALTLFHYGHWAAAETELTAVFDTGCAGETAWEGARRAWLALRQIATVRGQLDALAALGEALGERSCSFGGQTADCTADPQHPACLAHTDMARIRQVGGQRFMQRAQHGQGEERTRWATRAGETFLASLESEPPPSAFARALALAHAAEAFELAGATDRLAEVDALLMRLALDDYQGSEQEFAVQEQAHAISRRLEAAEQSGEARSVAQLAPRLLVDAFDTPDLSVVRERARLLFAQSQASLGRHRQAATAYAELAQTTEDASVRRDAALEAALEERAAGGCRRGRAGLRRFAETYAGQAGARDGLVRVRWELAACERQGSSAYFEALSALTAAMASSSGRLGAETRDHAAEAAFRLADRDFDQVTRLRLRLPRVDQVEEFTPLISAMIQEPAARVAELVHAYDAVEPLGSSEWSVAAATRGAAAVQALMNAIAHAEWELPTSVRRMLPRLSREASQQIRQGTEARIHELLEQQAERLRCRAASRFAHAAGLVTGSMRTDYAESARRSFAEVDADVLERCRQHNPSLFN